MIRRLKTAVDALAALMLGAGLVVVLAALALVPRWRRRTWSTDRPRRLLCLVAISLTDVHAKGILPQVLQRDLDGYFDEVISVHFPSDRSQRVTLAARHVVWEFSGYFAQGLADFPYLSMLLSEIRALGALTRYLRHNPAMVIKAQDPYLHGLNGFVLSRLTGTPFVTLIVSNYDLSYRSARLLAYPQLKFRWLHSAISRFVFSQTDLVQAMSDNNRAFAMSHGANASIAVTVRSGAAPAAAHFEPLANRTNVKSELQLSGKKMVLFVGRLSPEKYPIDVVECAEIVIRARPDTVFVFAGDGPLRPQIDELIAAKQLGESVKILGFVSQPRIMDLCYSADAVVAPLSGISLIEAALSGAPVVAYDVEWHSELIRNHQTGMLVPYRDVNKMADAVEWILAHPAEARAMGVAGRELALAQHRPEQVLREEVASYQRLLVAHGSTPTRNVSCGFW